MRARIGRLLLWFIDAARPPLTATEIAEAAAAGVRRANHEDGDR